MSITSAHSDCIIVLGKYVMLPVNGINLIPDAGIGRSIPTLPSRPPHAHRGQDYIAAIM
jgi:hypothetical protein